MRKLVALSDTPAVDEIESYGATVGRNFVWDDVDEDEETWRPGKRHECVETGAVVIAVVSIEKHVRDFSSVTYPEVQQIELAEPRYADDALADVPRAYWDRVEAYLARAPQITDEDDIKDDIEPLL